MEIVVGEEIHLHLETTDASQVGVARRFAATLARRLGFDETVRANAALVATELATNLVKHARGGEILIGPIDESGRTGIEILAVDRGPGMTDVGRSMRDGFSTAGSPGTGLGAITRAASDVSIFSMRDSGTAVAARLWPAGEQPSKAALEVGAFALPKRGEEISGDAWAASISATRSAVIVVDGLGHGPSAAEASRAAIAAFRRDVTRPPGAILEAAHAALRSTRGAAVGIAAIDLQARVVTFAGIGNIAAAILAGERQQQMVSHNGIVGAEVRKIQEFTYLWPEGALLIMHSDGLATQWRIDRYPGLAMRHPSLAAAILYRDFSRGRDDVTVVAAREAAGR
jgi:anti-sigma regulatory factor (Ser/Thr protein kinase)